MTDEKLALFFGKIDANLFSKRKKGTRVLKHSYVNQAL